MESKTYHWRVAGVEYGLEIVTDEGGNLETWRCWASLEPSRPRDVSAACAEVLRA